MSAPLLEKSLRNEPLLPRSASFGEGTPAWGSGLRCPSCSLWEAVRSATRAACVLSNALILAVGVLALLNPLGILLSPLRLLTGVYLGGFAAVAVAYEAELALLDPLREWVGVHMLALTQRRGRGVLYLLLGAMAAGLGDPLSLGAGLLELAVGAACVWGASPDGAPDDEAAEAEGAEAQARESSHSRVQTAFRRRVPFGLERLDSAELVALCLELGLSLDARARGQALDLLDPHQEGSIGEEAFVAWWEQQAEAPRPLGAVHAAFRHTA